MAGIKRTGEQNKCLHCRQIIHLILFDLHLVIDILFGCNHNMQFVVFFRLMGDEVCLACSFCLILHCDL